MAFIEASKTGSGGSGDGVPVGALMTFSGEELPEEYEPAETEEQISIQQLNDNLSKKIEITELWTNSSPSSSMADNTLINLSSADYDILIVIVKSNTTSNAACASSFALKGMDIFISYPGQNQNRILRYQSDTQYKVSSSTATDGCLPMKILGIKNLT